MNSSLSLEPFIYPLKGFIRFVVEDIETLGSGSRYSKSVKVGKTEWCISVNMGFSNWTNRLTCLRVYLKNLYDFNTEECVEAKLTTRLLHEVAQKSKETHIFEKVLYNFNTDGWRSRLEIENKNVVDEGYMKNGTITVECDFEIVSETIFDKSIDSFEPRPNNEDLRKMLSVADYAQKKKLFEVEFKINELSDYTIYSPIGYVDRIPCKIGVCREHSSFRVVLCCNSDDKSEWWRVEAAAEFRIENRDDPTKILSGSLKPSVFSAKNCLMEYSFPRNNAMENGYVKHGRICIETTVYIRNKYGFDEKTGRGIDKPMKKMTDAVITVEQRKFSQIAAVIAADTVQFHVSRMILSHQSPWFKKLFYNNPDKTEFSEDSIVEIHYFRSFLRLVHDKKFDISECFLSAMLELPDKYGAQECITRLDHQMVRLKIKNDMRMLKLIDKYELPKMKAKYAEKFRKTEEVKKILENPEVNNLSSRLKESLSLVPKAVSENKVVLASVIPERKNDNTKPFYVYSDFKEFSDPGDMVKFKFENGTIFHSSKQILANASTFFMKRFFGPEAEENDNVIELNLLFSDEINILLNHIYHPTLEVNETNLDVLSSLSQVFGVDDILSKCEDYLIKTDSFTVKRKEEYAKEYEMMYLLSACRNHINSVQFEKPVRF